MFFAHFVIIVAISRAYGQTAQLSGVVRDPSQAVVAGASVLVRNDDTRVERVTFTNSDGIYEVPFLAPGTYTVNVQAAGFRPMERTGVKLDVEQTARPSRHANRFAHRGEWREFRRGDGSAGRDRYALWRESHGEYGYSDGFIAAASEEILEKYLNVSVMVNGTAAALFAVDNVNGQEQINFQIPWEVASEPAATIVVMSNGTSSAPLRVPVSTAQPGIFAYSAGGQSFGGILHANFQPADAAHPANAGETVFIYCTGLGAVSSEPGDGAAGNGQTTKATPTVMIGGGNATVSFSGLAPGFVGLYQVNAEVPKGLGSGDQPVVLSIGGASSNSVLLPVS